MKPNMLYRQGDVLIERIVALPENLKKAARDKGRIILAYGEVTGHAHAITDETARSFVDQAGFLYLDIDEDVQVLHEEHTAIILPAGTYRVVRQREYSPEEIRNVQD